MAVLVERDHIGIFGKMNSGKSSAMNLITQQETSIVDSAQGTTADTRTALIELHGMGPVKLYDTAGIDELSSLGEKKKNKVFSDLKECDLVILIIDPSTQNFNPEKQLLDTARDLNKQIVVIYNIFKQKDEKKICHAEEAVPHLKFYRKIILKCTDKQYWSALINFILDNYESRNYKTELLPFVKENEFYVLNIPMDEETPSGRYLRPQAMVEEYITRNWAYPISFRMNLSKARSNNKNIMESEKIRFLDFINNFKKKPKAVITDSQAIDVVSQWLPEKEMLTTFSVVMVNYFSSGKLVKFAEGIKALNELKNKNKVLIVEACNHSRIGEDIGTVQIPGYFKKHYPGVVVEHNFGREFQDNNRLQEYKLIVHCGGCMISPQKMTARIRDLEALGIPYTNYGLFLAYIHGGNILKRVLKPWKVRV